MTLRKLSLDATKLKNLISYAKLSLISPKFFDEPRNSTFVYCLEEIQLHPNQIFSPPLPLQSLNYCSPHLFTNILTE